jgi:hypothetical protein
MLLIKEIRRIQQTPFFTLLDADTYVPSVSAALSSASVHDSQLAIPLMTLTSQRVRKCAAERRMIWRS